MAITQAAWQQDLQQQIERLKADFPTLAVRGPVTVASEGDELVASIPRASGSDAMGHVWTTPELKLHTKAAQNVVQSFSVQPQGTINMAYQGTSSTLNAERIDLQSNAADQLKLTLEKLQSTQGAVSALSVGHAVVTYKTKIDGTLSLMQLFTLLQRELGREPLLADVYAQNLHFKNDKQDFTVQDLVAQAQIEPQKNTSLATVRNAITVKGMTQNGFHPMAVFMPQNLDMVGTILNLPQTVLKGGMSSDDMRQAMAAAGTRINLESFKSETANGVVMNAQGFVKPALNVPTGLTGRVTLQLEKIQEAIAKMQQNPAQAQGVLGMMLLQGFGTQTGESTRMVLDMTPDGQLMLNGKDMSPLTRMFGAFGTPPAALAPTEAPAAMPSDQLKL